MKADENCNIVCIPLLRLCCDWFVEWCKIIREVNKWKEEYRKPVFSEIQVQTTITLFNFWHSEARYVL